MTTAAFTFSLSRAHSVADRLRQHAHALQETALATLGKTHLQHTPDETQVQALTARGTQALAQVTEARAALDAVGQIRTALAQANAEAGVTGLLAQIEAKRQESKLLDQVLAIDLLTRVPLTGVAEALANRATTEVVGYGRAAPSGVPVAVVPLNAFEDLRVARAALEAAIHALGDQVNDLNRRTVTVTLPDALAQVVGLR